MKSIRHELGGNTPHIILAPGRGLKCRCGDLASRFILCLRCREIVASCSGHKTRPEQERDEHCKDKP